MASRQQVRSRLEAGLDYAEIGRLLGIPAGQAYLVATGLPADGGSSHSGSSPGRPGVLASAQHLLEVPAANPTSNESVRAWIRDRVRSDPTMLAARSSKLDRTGTN